MSLRQTFFAALVVALAVTLIDALAPALAAGFAGAALAADRSTQPIPCEDIDSVGRAKMSADGTITLQLRSLWPDPIAESELCFAPAGPQRRPRCCTGRSPRGGDQAPSRRHQAR